MMWRMVLLPSGESILARSHFQAVRDTVASASQHKHTCTGSWSNPTGSIYDNGRPTVTEQGVSSSGNAMKSKCAGLPRGDVQEMIGLPSSAKD